MTDSRTPTAVDGLAERYFDATLELSPIEATYLGRDLNQDRYDDLSPDGLAELADLARRTLAEAEGLTPQDATDRVTLGALRERLGLEVEAHEAGADLLSLNGITSGLHSVREIHDQMRQDSDDDWALIGRGLHAVPEALTGWFASQHAAVAAGLPPAQRQVDLLVEQTRSWVAEGGYFDALRQAAGDRPAAVQRELDAGIAIAKQAYSQAADRLEAELGPKATEVDGVGRERYELASRSFLGTKVDIDETYEWGQTEVARLSAEMAETAELILPGASPAQAKAQLARDPQYQLKGTDALQAWMQRTADEAVAALIDGGHFQIPEPVRRIECRIADTQDGGIYYTQPSEDFSRPGRMWWSVPEGYDEFGIWKELTTVFHEGVPGHHLQLSLALANPQLNAWRRGGLWVSGHGEGWALYAERLMDELGFHTPASRMGMLDESMLRAVRVVIDVGVHCHLPAPAQAGGGSWTYQKAYDYFNAHVTNTPATARFEVSRYFGWPGQAPSYKLGERVWHELREQVRAAQGDDFDLAEFHQRTLELGTLGLDTLREAVDEIYGL